MQLESQVRSIGRRARHLVVLHAWLSFATVATAAALVAGGTDYLLRLQDPGLRIIVSFSVLVAAIWGVFRFVVPAFTLRRGDVDVAQNIERRFPALSDQLSNAIAFLAQPEDDPTCGSPTLRDVSVQAATQAVAGLRLHECLDISVFLRAAMKLLGVVAVLAVFGLCDPDSTYFAARRLVKPLGSETWPRRNVLMFTKRPSRLAVGEDFEVELVDKRGRLPEQVVLEYRFTDDPSASVQTKMMKPWGKPLKPWGERMACRLEDVTRSLEYRAVGGDDNMMVWNPLEVIEPPRIVDLQVQVIPPAYTHLPTEAIGRHIRVWEGTCVQIDGRLDRPLEELTLIYETPERRHAIPSRLTPEGYRFMVPAPGDESWKLLSSGAYWFNWVDTRGYRISEVMRSEIHVQQDVPPTVSISASASESFFTNQAVVPLRIVAKDDLAVQTVGMEFNDTRFELYRAPDQTTLAQASEPDVGAGIGDSQSVDYHLDLGQFPGIESGQTIDIRVVADDFKPQSGQTATLQITIISPQELTVRIDQRQSSIVQRLNEALRIQRTANAQTTLLESTLQDSGILSQDEVDYLQAADLNQRQVRDLLSGDVGGVTELIENLLNELRSNRIDQPQITDRLIQMRREVSVLAKSILPRIQNDLTLAFKSARAELRHDDASTASPAKAETGSAATTRESLATAAANQSDVIERLMALIGRLSLWEDFRQIGHDIKEIYRDQGEVAEQTAATSTAGMDLSALSPQERASLQRLVRRQTELARTFDRLQSRLDSSTATASGSDPAAAAAMDIAMETARGLAVGGLMREAAANMEGNRIGQAMQLHDELLLGLRQLVEQLDVRYGLGSRPDTAQEPAGKPPIASLQELLLIRLRQIDINERTSALAEKPKDDNRDDDRRTPRFDRVAEDQSQLAELVEQMLPESERGEPTPPPSTRQKPQGELDKAMEAAGIPGFGQPDASVGRFEPLHGRDVGQRQSSIGDDGASDNLEARVLLSVARDMRSIEEFLRSQDTTADVRTLQQGVVEALNDLIQRLSPGKPDQNNRSTTDQRSGDEAGTSPGDDPGRSTSEKTDSPPGQDTADADQELVRDLLLEIWGQLPEHLQEQIQSPVREQFLPSHERLIVEYYRRLAEE